MVVFQQCSTIVLVNFIKWARYICNHFHVYVFQSLHCRSLSKANCQPLKWSINIFHHFVCNYFEHFHTFKTTLSAQHLSDENIFTIGLTV